MGVPPVVDLFRYNAWATRQLIDFCRKLSPQQRRVELAGVYGNAERTLVHLVSAEDFYAFLLTGERLQRLPLEPDPVDFDELLRRLERNASIFETAALSAVDADAPTREQSNGRTLRTGMLLSQILSHCSEHRGQVRTILGANGIVPPDISAWVMDGGSED